MSRLRACLGVYAVVCVCVSSEGKLGVLPVVELCLYSLALSGYPTLPMSEGERWRDGRGSEEH